MAGKANRCGSRRTADPSRRNGADDEVAGSDFEGESGKLTWIAAAEIIDAIRDAGQEVSRPIFFGVLIIVLVYVPILTLGGVEGKIFKPMAATVLFALLASLIIALTLMPF